MNARAAVGIAMLVIAACTFTVAVAGPEHGHELPEGQAKAALKVTGMTCGACCTKVESIVKELDGIVKIKADYEKGVAYVVYETEKTDVDTIVKTINEKTSFKASAPEKA